MKLIMYTTSGALLGWAVGNMATGNFGGFNLVLVIASAVLLGMVTAI